MHCIETHDKVLLCDGVLILVCNSVIKRAGES